MISRIVRSVGELLITAGLVILLFVAYELWGTGLATARAQNRIEEELEREWEQSPATEKPAVRKPGEPPPKIRIGSGIAALRVPRFGKNWRQVVVEGVSIDDLKKGPGHYPGTELPGEKGNFVVSGHRTTYGAPFNKIDKLRPGDALVVETKDTWYTYRVTDADIVRPSQIEVTFPVPYQRGKKPTVETITLTSCHPKFSAKQRFIVFGELESALPKKTTPRPPALAEG